MKVDHMAHHIRIDEGIKRGTRKRRRPKRDDGKPAVRLAIIPSDLLPATVLERYLKDEKTSEIAESYGVSLSQLHRWLLKHAEEPWKQAQVAKALTALERAKDNLDEADNPLDLAKAREKLRGAQWELERLFSRLFGQKQEVTVVDPELTISAELNRLAREAFQAILSAPSQTRQPIELGGDGEPPTNPKTE
jgi:hypothetical protein